MAATRGWTRQADLQAREHDLLLIKDRCIEEDHRHLSKDGGHPARLGIHVSRRRRTYEDNRNDMEEEGYTASGGGDRKGGGGKRSVLDEKKWSVAVLRRRRVPAGALIRKQAPLAITAPIVGDVRC